MRGWSAHAGPGRKDLQVVGAALCQHLDFTAGQIADPSAEAESIGPIARGKTESYALHPSTDDQTKPRATRIRGHGHAPPPSNASRPCSSRTRIPSSLAR